jgi:hypothetical protein
VAPVAAEMVQIQLPQMVQLVQPIPDQVVAAEPVQVEPAVQVEKVFALFATQRDQ